MAHREVTREPYTPESWRPWRHAADEMQLAVNAYAAEAGVPRVGVETKRLARVADEAGTE
ncbi:hypothetical protein [Streptomyces sp. NPDC059134]|uniref:hypothetical protein n=1 Tax=Streptomyces sp. NPDC059134 TaxID=3346738 RepID=UPI0036BA1E79